MAQKTTTQEQKTTSRREKQRHRLKTEVKDAAIDGATTQPARGGAVFSSGPGQLMDHLLFGGVSGVLCWTKRRRRKRSRRRRSAGPVCVGLAEWLLTEPEQQFRRRRKEKPQVKGPTGATVQVLSHHTSLL